MKKIIHTTIMFALLTFFGSSNVFSQNVPSPTEVFNTATNFWIENDLAGFTIYTTNLYSRVATNHVAPTLLSAFHDYVFLGELASSSNKYARVQTKVTTSPEQFTEIFKGLLSISLKFVEDDMKMYNDANKPLDDAKTLAAPQEIRDDDSNASYILPNLLILKHSPDIEM